MLVLYVHVHTVKFVCKDHPRDQPNVVLIHRWSLYADSITWKVYPWGPVNYGIYMQVVFIYRWLLEQLWLYTKLPAMFAVNLSQFV